jgi:hypothetical protein
MPKKSRACRRSIKGAIAFAFAAAMSSAPAATTILFIGNSFTYGQGSPVRFYRSETITDLNGEGQGGTPALFKSFADQAGLDYDVYIETRAAAGLDWHLKNRLDLLEKRPWDIVVAHGLLDFARPGDAAPLTQAAKQLADRLKGKNPDLDFRLEAVFPRADQTYDRTGAWFGKGIEKTVEDIRTATDQAAASSPAIKGVIPVGEAWIRAMKVGFADTNPYDGIEAGKVNLWASDNFHASTLGYYLKALVVFGSITRLDPRSLSQNECSGYEFGLAPEQIAAMQQIAYDQLVQAQLLKPAPMTPPPIGSPERCRRPR